MTITHCRPGQGALRSRSRLRRPDPSRSPAWPGLGWPGLTTDGENAEQESSERHQERELITAYREQRSGERREGGEGGPAHLTLADITMTDCHSTAQARQGNELRNYSPSV